MTALVKRLFAKVLKSGRYLLIGIVLFLLAAHLLRWKILDIDSTTMVLLGISIIIPLSDSLSEISIPGLLSAKIKREEILEATEKVAQASESSREGSTRKSFATETVEELASNLRARRYWWIQNMVSQDPQVGLANARGQLILSIDALFRAWNQNRRSLRITESPGQMIDFLSAQSVINRPFARSIRNILRLTNRAAHGERVDPEDAEELANSVIQVLWELDYLYHEKAVKPVESKMISEEESRRFQDATYRVTTVTPLVENPTMESYLLDQYGLDQLLEGYEEYAQFLVGIEMVDKE
jgi:hypothetical protein